MNKGDLKKLSTTQTDNKAHATKGKILVALNAKTYFSNLAENSKFTFYCQNQFFGLHFYDFTFPLQY